jgi:adenylate cyclase
MSSRWFKAPTGTGLLRFPARLARNQFGKVTGACLTGIVGLIFCNDFIGSPLIRKSYDLPFNLRPHTVPVEAVLVRMDEQSHQELNLPYHQPWDRALHARLLERLTAEGARTAVFDVLFSGQNQGQSHTNPPPEEGTLRLGAAMHRHGRVVIASHFRKEKETGFGSGFTVEEPEELLKANSQAGLSEMQEDQDVVTRRLMASLRGPSGTRVPTLSWQAAVLEKAKVTEKRGAEARERWLNYYGPPGTIPSVSYCRALKDVPEGYFSNKVVFVGPFYPVSIAGVRVDTFGTPYGDSDARFHGVELHATALLNLVRGEWLVRPPGWLELMLILGFGAGVGALLPQLRPWWGLAVALGLGLLVALGGILLHARAGIWFPWLVLLAVQLPVALLWAVLFHAVRLQIDAAVLERSLSFYLSPKQVASVLSRPELLKTGGSEERISILFSDLANSSRFSERMPPNDLLVMLNQYCESAIGCVHQNDGTVVKIIGDSIFAIWNAPQPQANHELLACRTALQLHHSAVEFAEARGMPPLRTRIGLHVGRACVGNLGSHDRFDYTAVGREVNLASRLESLNKALGTHVLVSRDMAAAAKGQFPTRWLGYFRLAGFDAVVEVHELLPSAASSGNGRGTLLEDFSNALHQFHRGRLQDSKTLFEKVVAAEPDGPAKFYLEYLGELAAKPLPSNWTGDVQLREK